MWNCLPTKTYSQQCAWTRGAVAAHQLCAINDGCANTNINFAVATLAATLRFPTIPPPCSRLSQSLHDLGSRFGWMYMQSTMHQQNHHMIVVDLTYSKLVTRAANTCITSRLNRVVKMLKSWEMKGSWVPCPLSMDTCSEVLSGCSRSQTCHSCDRFAHRMLCEPKRVVPQTMEPTIGDQV